MKKCFYLTVFLTGFMILFYSANICAETMYVVDRLEVAVRANKGVEHAIVAVVRTDEKIEVLSTEGEYALIRSPNGVEGWMLRRYLTSSVPKTQEIEKLNSNIDKLKDNIQSAADDISKLKEDRRVLENNLRLKDEELKQTEQELNELKQSSADFIALRQSHEELKKQMQETALRADKLTEENRELRGKTNFMWFVAGVSAVLFGFFVGMILQSLRYYKRRKSRY